MATQSHDTVCALIQELAASDDDAIPNDTGQLFHQMRILAAELLEECDARCSAGHSDAPATVLRTAGATPQFADVPDWPATTRAFGQVFPTIKSPRILEWDYEGELSAHHQEQSPAVLIRDAVAAASR